MIAGLRECVRLLAPIAAEVEISQPVRQDVCGAPAPVLLKRIGAGPGKVEVSPPAVLNCAMVAGLHAWVEKTLQPAAREALGTSVVRLRNASGYACRARNGHPLGTDRLSEHALANAIDIAGFVTADGRTVDVVRSWGPTARDRREADKVAAARASTKRDTETPSPSRPSPPTGRPAPLRTDGRRSRPRPTSRTPGRGARRRPCSGRTRACPTSAPTPRPLP